MKRLHDLKKQLPGSARLNIFESLRIKGGDGTKRGDRPSETGPGQSGNEDEGNQFGGGGGSGGGGGGG